jgi:prepilin-type N-terminal cleavage/methylation domain-containing protein
MTIKSTKCSFRGFTLVELLIVIAIIAVLALVTFTAARRFVESGRKVQALAQFRNVGVGITMFISDYNKPPIPVSKRTEGIDTLYGDPGGQYSNGYLVAVLAGDSKDFVFGAETFSVKDVNPRGEAYLVLPTTTNGKLGVSNTDGNLYDPWGKQILIAVNGMKGESMSLVDTVAGNNGRSDSRLDTYGYGAYRDTNPRDLAFACWSFGKDGKKGNNGSSFGALVPYTGSDDVISW